MWTRLLKRRILHLHLSKGICLPALRKPYVSLVRPHLEYVLEVRVPYRQNQVEKLEAIQNCAVRFIKCHYSYNTSVSNSKNTLSLGLLSERRQFHHFSLNLCIIISLCLFRHTIYCLLEKLETTPPLYLFNHLHIMITINIVFVREP